MPVRPKTFKWLRRLLAGLSLLNSVGSRVLANLQPPSAQSTESVVVCVCKMKFPSSSHTGFALLPRSTMQGAVMMTLCAWSFVASQQSSIGRRL